MVSFDVATDVQRADSLGSRGAPVDLQIRAASLSGDCFWTKETFNRLQMGFKAHHQVRIVASSGGPEQTPANPHHQYPDPRLFCYT